MQSFRKISNAVCESIKHDHDREYDLNCGLDSIPTNFLKESSYGGQGNFPSGNNTRFNNDFPSGNNTHFNNDFPSGNNTHFNNNFPSGNNTHFNNDLKGYNPHTKNLIMDHLVGIDGMVTTMRDNLGLYHGEAEDIST